MKKRCRGSAFFAGTGPGSAAGTPIGARFGLCLAVMAPTQFAPATALRNEKSCDQSCLTFLAHRARDKLRPADEVHHPTLSKGSRYRKYAPKLLADDFSGTRRPASKVASCIELANHRYQRGESRLRACRENGVRKPDPEVKCDLLRQTHFPSRARNAKARPAHAHGYTRRTGSRMPKPIGAPFPGAESARYDCRVGQSPCHNNSRPSPAPPAGLRAQSSSGDFGGRHMTASSYRWRAPSTFRIARASALSQRTSSAEHLLAFE